MPSMMEPITSLTRVEHQAAVGNEHDLSCRVGVLMENEVNIHGL
jgi:hypothetical protein